MKVARTVLNGGSGSNAADLHTLEYQSIRELVIKYCAKYLILTVTKINIPLFTE